MATRPPAFIPSASHDISRPYFTQKVRLHSLHAQLVFDRGFELCANAIFSLSVVLRVIGTDEQAREVETLVDDRLDKMFEDMRSEVARLEKLADANGIEFAGVTYSNPKELEARITSPRAVRYIGLIREFDGLVGKFDTLWLSGSIPDGNYSSSLYEWKRRLLRIAGGFRGLASRASIAARKNTSRVAETDSASPAIAVTPTETESPVSAPVA